MVEVGLPVTYLMFQPPREGMKEWEDSVFFVRIQALLCFPSFGEGFLTWSHLSAKQPGEWSLQLDSHESV